MLHLPITSDSEAFGMAARATERVLVNLGEPGPEQRRALRSFVLAAVEAELDRLGAVPGAWRSSDSIDSIVSDQVYRARLLGFFGLALRFSAIDRLADGSGELGPEDSATLRQLFVLAEREPVQLYLPQPSAMLRVLGAPQHLSDWLPAASNAGRIASIEYEPDSPLPDAVAAPVEPADEACPLAPPRVEAFSASSARVDAEPLPIPERIDDVSKRDVAPLATQRDVVAPDPHQSQRCNSWAAQLQNMTGPKLHASVERAFLTAYVPLCREVGAGKAPAEARAAAEKWAEGFAQSYAAAFKQVNLRAKRPKMVKDVVELGVRWLGQHRARQCQLLLVKGMRFDLGQRLNEEIERRLAGTAVCAEQAVLWAALPSNSESQHIGGLDATRSSRPKAQVASPSAAVSAPGIDSVNIGGRELFRLDQLGDELSRTGESEPARLQRLAAALAERVVPWIRQQPPETLVVVFGDHGFHWQATEHGTSAAHRGGALPEQVLVSASAWLLSEPRQKTRAAAGLH